MEERKSGFRQTFMLALLTVAITFGLASCEDHEYTNLVEACKQVQLGMSEDQVRQKMGPPAKVETVKRNGRKFKILMYPAPPLVAMPPDVYIDAQSQQVQKVFCDDQYELVAPKDEPNREPR